MATISYPGYYILLFHHLVLHQNTALTNLCFSHFQENHNIDTKSENDSKWEN